MKRRHFLGAAAAGLAAAAWPTWLRDAFGDEKLCEKGSRSRLGIAVAAAFRRAQRAGLPLLCLVIPSKPDDQLERGYAYGELLNFGSDKDLAPLAGCEVVCATMADLRKIVPTAGQGEPMMVLIQTDRLPAVAHQINVELPEHARYEEKADEDRTTDARIAALAKALRAEIAADGRPAAVRAAEVRKRLRDKPPAGTQWARSSGCGFGIEDPTDHDVVHGGSLCGMGHVPEKCERFLYFFTRDEP